MTLQFTYSDKVTSYVEEYAITCSHCLMPPDHANVRAPATAIFAKLDGATLEHGMLC